MRISKHLPFLVILSFFLSCGGKKKLVKNSTPKNPQILYNAFVITDKSTDNTYGYNKKNPIHVGGVKDSEGALNQRRFLNALLGPNGEEISYYRAGSCCHFKTKNGILGSGLLDIYRITWENSKDTVALYINFYDKKKLKIPVGFTSRFE